MTIGSVLEETPEPFPQAGLDALVLAAAADDPDSILICDDDGALTAAEVARRIHLTAAYLRTGGLVAGERVLIVAGAQTNALVALASALSLGLEPALAPMGLGPVELAAHARAADAAALVGPSHYGAMPVGEAYLSAAAIADSVRMVATQGPEPVDGAADLSPEGLAGLPVDPALLADRVTETPVVATFSGPPQAPTLILHRQAALFADALSLVEQARINPTKRIVSTLPPATLAGLVAGPFAAFVGASSLALHGPFEANRFLALLDAQRGSHLVAPCAIAPMFEDRRLTTELTSLILVSRFAEARSFTLPPPLACDRPMVDLYAFGEDTLLARRRTDGEARPPVRVTDKSLGGVGADLNRARGASPERS